MHEIFIWNNLWILNTYCNIINVWMRIRNNLRGKPDYFEPIKIDFHMVSSRGMKKVMAFCISWIKSWEVGTAECTIFHFRPVENKGTRVVCELASTGYGKVYKFILKYQTIISKKLSKKCFSFWENIILTHYVIVCYFMTYTFWFVLSIVHYFISLCINPFTILGNIKV